MKRHIERFATPRADMCRDDESMTYSTCFDLRRSKAESSHTNVRGPPASPLPPLLPEMFLEDSYRYYMDEDYHPFITTPLCLSENV